jgi:TPP-dependent pyruvate/acetoin dehydrogenase alpha subunit
MGVHVDARRRALADLRRSTWAAPTADEGQGTATSTWPTRTSACSRWSATCRDAAGRVGCALAFRIREENRVAVGWFGEGASRAATPTRR